MSLYLCVYNEEDDEELDGVDVGAYSDFGHFTDIVHATLEHGRIRGSRFPVLLLHSDCDGKWSAEECEALVEELGLISTEFANHPPIDFFADWQKQMAQQLGLRPQSLYDCFIDVDGEPLLGRMMELAKLACRRGLPILFQ